MASGARCSRQHAQSAARIRKYPSNPAVTDQFTAVIATTKSNRVDNTGLISGYTRAGYTWPVYAIWNVVRNRIKNQGVVPQANKHPTSEIISPKI